MSNARKITRLVGLMVLMAFAFTALTGSASAATKKQSRALLKQVKKNPAIVKNKKFIKKAAALDFKLPVTVRFSRCLATAANDTSLTTAANDCAAWQPANDVIDIDLGTTLGNGAVHQSTLSGVLQLWAEFGDPRDGDAPGDLRLSAAAGTPNLSLTGIDVLSNADILGATVGAAGSTGVGTNGCSDVTTPGLTYGATSAQPAFLLTDWGSRDPITVGDNVVFRTAPIDVDIDAARGTANLFDGDVDLTVETTVTVNSVFRELDNESPLHCVVVQTGASTSSGVTVQARESAGLEIDPAVTKDGKLRLANVILTNGPVTRPEIQACLAPIRPYNMDITQLSETALDLADATYNTVNGGAPGAEDVAWAPGNLSYMGANGSDFTLLGTAGASAIPCGTLPGLTYSSQFNLLYGKVDTMDTAANHVELRPDVSINSITAEGLIGHFTA